MRDTHDLTIDPHKHFLHAVHDTHNDGAKESSGVIFDASGGVAGYLSRRSLCDLLVNGQIHSN